MKFLYFLLLLFCASLTASAQHKTDTLFFDNFNGKTLNRDKWNVESTGYTPNGYFFNHEQQAYVDSANVLIQKNGLLTIKPKYLPGYTTMQIKSDFVSGRINTLGKFEFTYGTVSARIKAPAGDGFWPTFWLMGKGTWPACGEIDIMEAIGDATWISHAAHGSGYSAGAALLQRIPFPKGTDITKWHVYTLNWTANKLTFSIDGKVTFIVTKEMAEKRGQWAFDTPKYIILNLALGGDYPNAINGISNPYRGLAQVSVDKVKAGKVDMQIDWVRVIKN